MRVDLSGLLLVVLVACGAEKSGSDSGTPTDTDTETPTVGYPTHSASSPTTPTGSTAYSSSYSSSCSSYSTPDHSGYYICGRPLVVDGVHRAPAAGTAGWTTPVTPSGGDAESAAAWLRQGLDEHASIGSFARFTLDLLAVGAPAELVALAQQAAADEVVHARLCFGLAAALGGGTPGPGPLVLPAVPPCSGLAELAVRTLLEGCLNETVATAVAIAQRTTTDDPELVRVFDTLIADESRHAALAWKTVAWALRVGGPEVRLAVQQGLASWRPTVAPTGRTVSACGWLSDADQLAVVERAHREVVAPAAQVLLAA
jgi:hypothetical protein